MPHPSKFEHEQISLPSCSDAFSARDVGNWRVWLERTLKINREKVLNQISQQHGTLLAEFDALFAMPAVKERSAVPQITSTEVPKASALGGPRAASKESLHAKMNFMNSQSYDASREITLDQSCTQSHESSERRAVHVHPVVTWNDEPWDDDEPERHCSAKAIEYGRNMKSHVLFQMALDRTVGDYVSDQTKARMVGIYTNRVFHFFSVFLILINLVLMAGERQWFGLETGYKIGFYHQPPNRFWFDELFWKRIGIGILILFIVEALVRIGAAFLLQISLVSLDTLFLCMDVVVICLDCMSVLGMNLGLRPSLLRCLRLCRMGRFLSLVRKLHIFDSLYVLVRAIRASMSALIWSFIVLLMLQVLVALVLNYSLLDYTSDEQMLGDESKRYRIFEYFGTFSRALITMFEISVGNWVPTCRILMEDISEWYVVFFLFYRCFFCFGLVGVVSAVFIAETNRALAHDEDLEVRQKWKIMKKNQERMAKLFPLIADNGAITKEGFAAALEDEHIRSRVAALDIRCHDLEALFDVLDNMDATTQGMNVVELHDFIAGMSLLRGQASSLDVMYLRSQVAKLHDAITRLDNHQRWVPRLKSDVSAVSP